MSVIIGSQRSASEPASTVVEGPPSMMHTKAIPTQGVPEDVRTAREEAR